MASNERRAGALFSYLYMAVQMVVQLLYVPLLLNTIGQTEYGLYQLVGSVMSYVVSINGVLSAGVGRYYCMYKTENNERQMENTLAIAKRLYWLLSTLSALAVIVLIAIVQIVYANSFSAAELEECSLMLVVMGLNTIVTMHNTINIAAITASERFVFLKVTQLIAMLVQPVLILMLVQIWPNAIVVTLVIFTLNVICALVQRQYALDVLKVRYTFHGWDKSLAKGLLTFSFAIILVALADQIFWKTDQLIVGYFMGPGAVAVYAIGSQIYTVYMLIGTAMTSVFLPRVSELFHAQRNMDAISKLFTKVGRISFLICGFVLGAFVILGQTFISLWAGDGYSESYWVALIVMVPFTIDLIQNLGLTILQVADKYYFRGFMYFGISLINVVATIYFLQAFGLKGAAFSTAVAMVVGNGLIMNWYYKRKIGLDITSFWKEIGKLLIPFMAATGVFAIIWNCFFAMYDGWCSFILSGCVYAIIYASVQWCFGMNQYEKGLIKGLFQALHLG